MWFDLVMEKTWVALLRGINLGAKNRIPMKALSGFFEDLGCHRVRTFIQSGNVVFSAGAGISAKVAEGVQARIAAEFGYKVPVILRNLTEMERAVANNPFIAAGMPEDALHILFLADEPKAVAVASLDPNRSPPDAFAVRGREVYLSTPNGIARTKLTNAWFDSKLSTLGTGRNWRTCVALAAMMKE